MYVYILQSELFMDTFYTGMTENIHERLKSHNSGQVKHTSKYRPWKIKNYFWFEDGKKGRNFERYLKSGSGRAFCKKHF